MHAQQCAEHPSLNPCMFEYVYLARPDSIMDGVSVYQARLNLGETLAQRVISTMPPNEIDVVIPIPESSRPSAMQLAQRIGKPYREGFVKNRYVGRTFIMPGQGVRKKSVRQKLNAIGVEFKGRNVLLVDDSIVRGTTSQGDRADGARRRRDARSTWPRPRRRCAIPNVYGIDMPTKDELIAHDRSIEEIRQFIGADALIYQDVAAMKRVVAALNPTLDGLRGLVLRRRLHHRRRQRRRTSTRWRRSARAQRRRGRRRRRPRRADAAERGGARLMAGREDSAGRPAGAASARHARGARGPAAERLGRELGGALPHQQLRPARRGDRGGALRQRGRSVHLFALHQPDGDDVRAAPRRARGHRGVHRDVERHERDPAARHGPAEGRRPCRLLAERVRLDDHAVRPRVREVRRRDHRSFRRPTWRVARRDASRTRSCCSPSRRPIRSPRSATSARSPALGHGRRRLARGRQLLLLAGAAAPDRLRRRPTSSIPAPSTSTARAA